MAMHMNYSALMRVMSAADVEKVVRHALPVKGILKDTEPRPRLKLV